MNRQTGWAAVSVAVLALAGAASGASIVFDDFEYASQSAFEAVWAPLTTPGGTLSTTQAQSPTHSINYATTAQRNGRAFTATTPTATNPVTFSFYFYDSDDTVSPYRQYANLQAGAAPSLTGDLISIGLNNNLTNTPPKYMARILGFNSSAYFKLDDAGSPDRSTGWHKLAAVVFPTEIKFYVDDTLSKTVTGLSLGAKSYDTLRLGSGLTSTREAFFDDMTVHNDAVPEPAALSLIGLGALGLLRRRRR